MHKLVNENMTRGVLRNKVASKHKISQKFNLAVLLNSEWLVFMAQISGQPWRDLDHVYEQGGELGGLFFFLPQV